MTFVDNMKAKGDSVYMILNSGDKDTHSLSFVYMYPNLSRIVPAAGLPISSVDTSLVQRKAPRNEKFDIVSLSVFEFLLEEQKRRQKILDMARVTKVQELRERILANYNREKNGNPAKGTWAEMRKDWTWFKQNHIDCSRLTSTCCTTKQRVHICITKRYRWH